jgi:arsenate reductase
LAVVLFICIQNSCRSQMAEAIFNHLAPEGMRAISAGSKPAGQVDPVALAVLEETGIKTGSLSPKLLTREIAQAADTIVTMGCPEACPAVGKPMEDWGIEDPSGEEIDDYRRVRDTILQKVKTLLNRGMFGTMSKTSLKDLRDHRDRTRGTP